MYRESLLGLALSATLEEMAASSSLTEGQKESIWGVFDATMDKCLAELPMMTRITVRAPPPEMPDASTFAGTSRHLITDPSVRISEAENLNMREEGVTAPRDCLGEGLGFPVYRCLDGVWTLILKDPTVEVRDEYGAVEAVRLDYLKVYLKGTAATVLPKKKKPRKG